jgi:molybdate transport system substrate-binding protein
MKRVDRTIPKTWSRAASTPRLRPSHAGSWRALLGLLWLVAGTTSAEEVVVGAAASLREPLGRLERAFESAHPGSVAISFGASSWIATQIRLGAPVDVFLSADARQVDALERDGFAAEATRVVFASNELTLIVSPHAELDITEPGDITQPGLRRFALPAAAVPLGHYARGWLERRGLIETLGDRIVQTADARATLAAVELGQADAALVYATDAAMAHRARIVFTPPREEQPSIVYVGVLTPRGRAKPEARAFLGFLLGPGRSELEADGFLPPGDR